MLTAFVDNRGPSAKDTGNDIFVIVFKIFALHVGNLLVEQGLSHEFAFNKKAFKTFDEFRISCKRSKFECRRRSNANFVTSPIAELRCAGWKGGLTWHARRLPRGGADDSMAEERSFVPLMKFGVDNDDAMRDHTNSRVRMRRRKFTPRLTLAAHVPTSWRH